MPLAFISYRHDDTSQLAQALYFQLKEVFGTRQLFMDAYSLRAGVSWPDTIREKLAGATVVLALMGPGWLTATDPEGRRRIEQKEDWVRKELLTALDLKIPVIPVPFADTVVPDAADLPADLRDLSFRQTQPMRLGANEWSADMGPLRNVLIGYGLHANPLPAQPTPNPKIIRDYPALKPHELAAQCAEIGDWEIWSDTLPQEYPNARDELRRILEFHTFQHAIRFMAEIAPDFDATDPEHHPRWSNDWMRLRISLTTWDVQNKITMLDIRAAKMIDAAYAKFMRG